MTGSDHYPKNILIFTTWKLDRNTHALYLRLQRAINESKEGSLVLMIQRQKLKGIPLVKLEKKEDKIISFDIENVIDATKEWDEK